MELKSFAYWLQGYFELSGSNELTADQVDVIKKHLALVFKHDIDPSYGDAEKQKELNGIHGLSKVGGMPKDTLIRC